MKVMNLIGKLAIRTKPICYGRDDFSLEKIKDYSYTTEPIHILKVTDSHIIYNYQRTNQEGIFGCKTYLLDSRWNDNNWIDYEELMHGIKEDSLGEQENAT